MKKLIVMLMLCALCLMGCELLQQTDEVIGQADYYITDPNSPVQITAEQLEGLVAVATTAVVAIPGFPYAKAILGALAVINAAIALILKLRKRTTEKTLAAVVQAVNLRGDSPAKKRPSDKAVNTTVGELIKDEVAENLQNSKIYRQGKAIIQDAKNWN